MKITSAPAAKYLQRQRVKIAHIVEFTTSKFCTFNDFFHFLGLSWSLNDVKNNFGPSKGADID